MHLYNAYFHQDSIEFHGGRKLTKICQIHSQQLVSFEFYLRFLKNHNMHSIAMMREATYSMKIVPFIGNRFGLMMMMIQIACKLLKTRNTYSTPIKSILNINVLILVKKNNT